MRSMSDRNRDAALSACAIAVDFADWLQTKLVMPGPQLDDLRGIEPEAAAAIVRNAWSIGEQPIKNMVHLLESKGVRVFSLVEECRQIDAVSFWRDATPFVFLNTMKSAERSRFDAAHELGHLVLHRHGTSGGDDVEKDADKFASAFLMPRSGVLASASRLPSLDALVVLKCSWSVSVAALVRRLYSIGLLEQWYYESLCVQMSQRGFIKAEPDPIPRETSQLLPKAFKLLRDSGITRQGVARHISIDVSELERLVFGLVTVSVHDGETSKASPPRRDHLRIVGSTRSAAANENGTNTSKPLVKDFRQLQLPL